MSLVNVVRQSTFTTGTRGSGAQAGGNEKTISMEMGTASSTEAEEACDCEVISGNGLRRLAVCNHRSAAALVQF